MTEGNVWLDRGVVHWAHQGGAREAPSNTLYAMRKGLGAGAHGLEFDVHLSADGHVVLGHDAALERTTNGTGKIGQHSLADLRQLDAAYWWVPDKVDDHEPTTPVERYVFRGRAPADTSLTIPTLAEVLAACPDSPLTIEVKDPAAVEALVRVLREHHRRDDVIVTSFRDSIVRKIRRLAPELSLAPGRLWNLWFGLRVRLRCGPKRSNYVALQLPPRYRWFTVVDRPLIEAAHRAGMAVHVWTIDEEHQIRRLISLGVDGILTDRPSVLTRVLPEPKRHRFL